ncbi:MAG TPA: hypothetical protein VH478_03715 [Trebonia sp.]|nr:hypothetical protein [Trebonia sp.]
MLLPEGVSGCGHGQGGQRADEIGGEGARRDRDGRARRAGNSGCGRGEAGDGALPGDDAPGGEHAEAERERLAPRVQGGMAELLVAGVQPAAGNRGLAGIRARARFSSRVAR